MMNPEKKAAWVAALRSGEYPQCKGRLKRERVGYCCLGVLTDLAVKDGVGSWETRDQPTLGHAGTRYFVRPSGSVYPHSILPEAVVKWAGGGISQTGYFTDTDGRERYLTEMNDEGATFAEIADAIERYF